MRSAFYVSLNIYFVNRNVFVFPLWPWGERGTWDHRAVGPGGVGGSHLPRGTGGPGPDWAGMGLRVIPAGPAVLGTAPKLPPHRGQRGPGPGAATLPFLWGGGAAGPAFVFKYAAEGSGTGAGWV